jgi:hypothetical protein
MGISAETFGRFIGKSASTVHDWETGYRCPVASMILDLYEAIDRHVDVESGEFLEWDKKKLQSIVTRADHLEFFGWAFSHPWKIA